MAKPDGRYAQVVQVEAALRITGLPVCRASGWYVPAWALGPSPAPGWVVGNGYLLALDPRPGSPEPVYDVAVVIGPDPWEFRSRLGRGSLAMAVTEAAFFVRTSTRS